MALIPRSDGQFFRELEVSVGVDGAYITEPGIEPRIAGLTPPEGKVNQSMADDVEELSCNGDIPMRHGVDPLMRGGCLAYKYSH